MKDRRKILEENMTEVKDSIMFSEIKSIKVVVSVVSWQFSLMNLFCSLAVLRGLATPWTYFLYL